MMEAIEYLWKDRKRFWGMPLSFTRYRLSEDRLFCETGFLNVKSDEVLLYRVRDLRLTMNLGQRIFGVGTVCVVSSEGADSPECGSSQRPAPHTGHGAVGRRGRSCLSGA